MAVVIIWVTMGEDRRMENEDSGTEVKLTFVMVKNNDSIRGHVKKKQKKRKASIGKKSGGKIRQRFCENSKNKATE